MFLTRQTIHWIFGLGLLLSIALAECTKIDSIAKHPHSKRSTSKDAKHQFKTLDKDVDIYLNPIDGVLIGEETPVWVAEHNSDKVAYRQLGGGIMKRALEDYQSRYPDRDDLVFRASDDQSMEVDAVVEDLTTTQVPERKTEAMDDLLQRSSDPTKISIATLAEQLDETKQQNNKDHKKIVFPTILVTTDFNVAMETEDDSEYYEQLIYQLAFWNAVDLKFRNATNPKIRLRIAGIIIGSTRETTTYLNQHMNGGKINVNPAIRDMEDFWQVFGSHCIVATVTNLELLEKSWMETGQFYNGMTLGSVPHLCNEKRIIKGKFPMIIIHDDQSFGGINPAVHEVAHALGADHDGESGSECDGDDGYLMAPATSEKMNNPKWSKCTLKELSESLRGVNCIDEPQDINPTGKPLGKILPGTLKTAKQQCQARGFDEACETTPDICKSLKCWNSSFKIFQSYWICRNSHSAAEGTECATGRVCLDGECRHLYPPETKQKSLDQLKKSLIVTDFKSGSA